MLRYLTKAGSSTTAGFTQKRWLSKFQMSDLGARKYRVYTIPIFEDNYSYLLCDGPNAIAIDPAEPSTITDVLNSEGLSLSSILTTHKHWDHAGGNMQMREMFPDVEVFGPDKEPVEGCTRALRDNEELSLHAFNIRTIHSPGHTDGHVMYYVKTVEQRARPVLFSGDTLFVAGCGKLFEGTAKDMYETFYNKIAKLPDETLVFCGHEYTASNLRFAASLTNEAHLQSALASVESQLADGGYTVPSTIEREKQINPYLRVHEPELQAAVGGDTSDPIEVFRRIRERKDSFK